jgi:hypothetical protein
MYSSIIILLALYQPFINKVFLIDKLSHLMLWVISVS